MRKGWEPALAGVKEAAGQTLMSVQTNLRWLIDRRGLTPPLVAALAGLGERTLDHALTGRQAHTHMNFGSGAGVTFGRRGRFVTFTG